MGELALTTEHVWHELHGNIRSFVGRRVRRAADVDDIVQRVFLHVHRGLPNLRDAAKLHAWVYQATRRAIADYYRTPAQKREVQAADGIPENPAPGPADENEASALRELSGCLQPLIGSLSAVDQEALRLVEFDGLTQIEAAGRLGLSTSGMKSRVQRARVHLKTALDECCRFALDRRGGVIDFERRSGNCGGCDPCGDDPTD